MSKQNKDAEVVKVEVVRTLQVTGLHTISLGGVGLAIDNGQPVIYSEKFGKCDSPTKEIVNTVKDMVSSYKYTLEKIKQWLEEAEKKLEV